MYSINASGTNLSGNQGFVSYSIGQVFYSSSENNTHTLTEGVQQNQLQNSTDQDTNTPEDSNVPDDLTPDLNVLVYPNPTHDVVTLVSNGFNLSNNLNSYQLYNYQGKLIKTSIIQQTNTIIDLSHLSTSFYILQVFSQEKLFKTIKIVKK
ncbi:hypothetical protein GCM10023315_28970 [Algibacter aquimarinus]|uniref:Secretion system C-terminal sorting domain-containing protein n=2 Tax=Algibacter aquimarinus TaxID=1136748 RepID=A0ABP9HQK9_9FLAO